MGAILLTAVLAATPTFVRVDLEDAQRSPTGASTPLEPLVVLVKAPAAWVSGSTLTERAKDAVLAAVYGRADWSAAYEVKTLRVVVVDEKGLPAPAPGQRWYEVDGREVLVRRSGSFEPLSSGPSMKRLADAADGTRYRRGPALTDTAALRAALEASKGLVKLPTTLQAGTLGFDRRTAQAGPLTFDVDDTRLGVPLSERARGACGKAPVCTLWLVGRWVTGATPTLEVSRVGSRVDMPESERAVWLALP
ncbi:MAG: hypothetical protein SFW67_10035 [Myxococcaceae bacterium]|nr:hypothetical protein [Myxococcaceae bacterium]